jgi:hypothetical protein
MGSRRNALGIFLGMVSGFVLYLVVASPHVPSTRSPLLLIPLYVIFGLPATLVIGFLLGLAGSRVGGAFGEVIGGIVGGVLVGAILTAWWLRQ